MHTPSIIDIIQAGVSDGIGNVSDKSPLRRALRLHFTRFEGLTSPKTSELEHFFTDGEEAIIYKDTASGISA